MELSHGKCHYILSGSDNAGPLVVLIHGFLGSSAYYKWLAEHLVTKHQRRVLRYDNYGRGWSGCSGAPHTANLFAGQLAELLYALNEDPSVKIDLVGYSMGGAIASRFAAAYGEQKLRSLVLLAPAGHREMDKANAWWLLARFLQLPVLPRILARYVVSIADPLKDWEAPDGCAHVAEYVATEKARGQHEPVLPRSMLNTLREFTMGAANEPSFASIGKTALPTLLVWGKKDTVVPYTGAAVITALVPQARLATLDTGMHCMVIERPAEVADIISEWWSDLS